MDSAGGGGREEKRSCLMPCSALHKTPADTDGRSRCGIRYSLLLMSLGLAQYSIEYSVYSSDAVFDNCFSVRCGDENIKTTF